VRTGALAALALLLSACGAGRPPAPLRGYPILVAAHDSLADALARALRARRLVVWRRPRGAGPPTAALVTFFYRDSTRVRWLAVRLADTRSGAVLAAVSVPWDSLGPSTERRAQALADSIAARLGDSP